VSLDQLADDAKVDLCAGAGGAFLSRTAFSYGWATPSRHTMKKNIFVC
jgi:hypothetical protein